jgi:hypothetical protein
MSQDEIRDALDSQFGGQQPETLSTGDALLRAGKNIVNAPIGLLADIPDTAAIIANAVGSAFQSSDSRVPFDQLTTHKFAEWVRSFELSNEGPKPPGVQGFVTDTLPSMAGNVAALATGSGLASKILPKATSLALGMAAQQGVGAFNEARQAGATDAQQFEAWLVNAGIGAASSVPIAHWLSLQPSADILKEALKEGSIGAATAAIQQIASNAAAKGIYDPQRPWLQGAGEASAAGLTLGGLVGLIGASVSKPRKVSPATGIADPAVKAAAINSETVGAPETAMALAEVDQVSQSNENTTGTVQDPLLADAGFSQHQAARAVLNAEAEAAAAAEMARLGVTQEDLAPAQEAPKPAEETPPQAAPEPTPEPAVAPAKRQLTEEEKDAIRAELEAETGHHQAESPKPPEAPTEPPSAPPVAVEGRETPPEANGILKKVQKEIDRVNKALGTMIEKVQIQNLDEGAGIASATRAGEHSTLVVDPARLEEAVKNGANLRDLVNEEVIHSLQGKSIEAEWKRLGEPGEFREYFDKKFEDIATEMTPQQKEWIQKLYGEPLGSPVRQAVEYVRALLQEKYTGRISEAGYNRTKQPAMTRLLEAFKDYFWKFNKRGAIGNLARQQIQAIDKLLLEGKANARKDKWKANKNAKQPIGVESAPEQRPLASPEAAPEPVTGPAAEPSAPEDASAVAAGVRESDGGDVVAPNVEADRAQPAPEAANSNAEQPGAVGRSPSKPVERGSHVEATRQVDVTLPEEAQVSLYESAHKASDNSPIDDTSKDLAFDYIHSRLTNRAEAYFKENGNLEGFAASRVANGLLKDFYKWNTAKIRSGERMSLDAPIGEEEGASLSDTISKSDVATSTGEEKSQMRQVIEEAKSTLPKELQDVLDAFLDNPHGGIAQLARDKKIAESTLRSRLKLAQKQMARAMMETSDGRELAEEFSPEDLTHAANPKISAEQDRDYLDAVRYGDIPQAQRMVDKAAKEAGYTIGPVWHGTNANPFTSFEARSGAFFTDSVDIAQVFGKSVGRYHLRIEHPSVSVDTSELGARDIKNLSSLGHDSAIGTVKGLKNKLGKTPTEYVVFDPSQIKSADPVTYDDAGNVIPLSRRFGKGGNDIRFSFSPDDLINAANPVVNAANGAAELEPLARYLGPWERFKRVFRPGDYAAPGLLIEIANTTKDADSRDMLLGLAKMIPRFYDKIGQLSGRIQEPFFFLKNRISAKEELSLRNEWESFWAAHEARDGGKTSVQAYNDAMQIYQTLSPKAKKMVDAGMQVGEFGGQFMATLNDGLGHFVKDGNKVRSMKDLGTKHYPRMLSQEIDMVLSDPDAVTNRARFIQLMEELTRHDPEKFPDLQTAIKYWTEHGLGSVADGAYEAGVDLARGAKLPDSWHDYSFDGWMRAKERWVNRVSQVWAFGDDVPAEMQGAKVVRPQLINAFDQAIRFATREKRADGDPGLKTVLAQIRDDVFGTRQSRLGDNWVHSLRSIGTVRYLSAILTSVRNVSQAVITTAEHAGIKNTVISTSQGLYDASRAAYRSMKLRKFIEPEMVEKAAQIGAMHRAFNFQSQYDLEPLKPASTAIGKAYQRVGDVALLGQNLSESFNRGISAAAFGLWARDAVRNFARNPDSRDILQRRAELQRWGFDSSEQDRFFRGDTEMVNRLIRVAVREKQYGYKADQVPAIFRSPGFQLLTLFQSWGIQRTRDFARNIWTPMLRGTDVELPGGEVKTVRDIMPMMRFIVGSMAGAAAMNWLKDEALGRKLKDPSWQEIINTNDDDTSRAILLAFERIWNDLTMTGGAGLLPDYLRSAKDWTTQGRNKSLANSPALQIASDITDFIRNQVGREGDPKAFWRDFRDTIVLRTPLVKEGNDLATHFLLFGEDAQTLANAKQTIGIGRAMMQRWIAETGKDALLKRHDAGGGKTPNSETYDQINEALLEGDTTTAGQLINDFTNNRRDRAKLNAIQASVRGRVPLAGEAKLTPQDMQEFFLWADSRNPEAADVVKTLIRDYHHAANRVGLR